MDDATERLRALLDERGIEHMDVGRNTGFNARGLIWHINYSGLEDFEGLHAECITPMTPEQVIASTVGVGTCKRIYHPNRINKKCTCSNCGYGASDERWAYCPKCGHKYVHGEVEERWKRAGRKVAE